MLTHFDGEGAGRTCLKPRIPSDAVDAVVIEAMDDLPHPLDAATDRLRNHPIGRMVAGNQDDPGVATVHGVAPQVFQAVQLDLFIRAKRAYLNSVFHGTPPEAKPLCMPLGVSYSNPSFAAAHKSPYVNGLRRESCQLKTALAWRPGPTIAATSELLELCLRFRLPMRKCPRAEMMHEQIPAHRE